VLGVRWLVGTTEPLPRLRVGEPITLRNLLFEHVTRFEPPPGAEHLSSSGTLHVCLCGADTLGSRCASVLPHNAERAAHLRPELDELALSLQDPSVHRCVVPLLALAFTRYSFTSTLLRTSRNHCIAPSHL